MCQFSRYQGNSQLLTNKTVCLYTSLYTSHPLQSASFTYNAILCSGTLPLQPVAKPNTEGWGCELLLLFTENLGIILLHVMLFVSMKLKLRMADRR